MGYGVSENFPTDEFTRGKLFADAMLSASARLAIDRALAEVHPLSTREYLGLHETENGIVPLPTDTTKQRRARLYSLKRLILDGRESSIYAALLDFLGDSLVFYRTTKIDELTSFDTGNAPSIANHVGFTVPIRICKLLAPVVDIGKPINIPIEYVAGDESPYEVGQVLAVNPGSNSRFDKVILIDHGDTYVRASFHKPHDKGALITSGHHPRYPTNKRLHQIVLTEEAALDRTIRNHIDFLMNRMVKGTARWQILREQDPVEAGPFTVDNGYLNADSISEVIP